MLEHEIHTNLQPKYNYDPLKYEFQSINKKYKVYKATQKDLNINVTIKITIGAVQSKLVTYLQKLKSVKSEFVIKIYEIITTSTYLVIVTEQINYGTLAQALINCKKFDDQDSIYFVKYLLNGHIDMLRSGLEWSGTTNDIQITDSGIKLSWNNTMSFTEQTSNSIRAVLQEISNQKLQQNQQRLLPSPVNKQLVELIKLSQTNASEISLNPLIKKKQKYLKKKFKNYVILKQTKNIAEYFQQTVCLAVSKQNGFVRIKIYSKGTVNNNILELNKSKNTFTKVIQTIQEGNKTYIVSAYSNGGSLLNYVQKLKNAGIQLKEDQIEFFFYSLFEPIKHIQQSTLKSLNMSLHIKNVYIENGIPKIGQPVPLDKQTEEKLIQKADVPDFYHHGFKRNPKLHDPSHDTYSLGVLLYKLMYTEYPIFPNGKVHIPTAPTYNQRLKKTLEIFLNQGGKLIDIEKRIEVSQTVLTQVKKNKQKLLNDKKILQQKNKKTLQKKYHNDNDGDVENEDNEDKKEEKETEQDQEEVTDDCFDCCVNLEIAQHSVDPQVQSLEQSPYKIYRHVTKVIVMLLIYILILYLKFLENNFGMISHIGDLQTANVTISTVKYEIITEDLYEFYLKFNQTSKAYADLESMGCFINNQNGTNYSDIVYAKSSKWAAYIFGGLFLLILIMFMKSYFIFKFDYIKTKFNYQHGLTNYNYSNYLIGNLLQAALINHHFYFFNIIFYSSLPECLGNQKSKTFSHIKHMFSDNSLFLSLHLSTLCGYIVITFLHFIMVAKTDNIKYSKIFNPIFIFTPFIVAYWIIVRIGVLSDFFYPSGLRDEYSMIKTYFKDFDYIGILGIVPQILFVIEFSLNKFIDLSYWLLIDKRRRIMIINETSTQNIKLNE